MQLDALSNKLKTYENELAAIGRDKLLLDDKILRQLLLLEQLLPDKFASILNNILTNFTLLWSHLFTDPDPYHFMIRNGK